MEQSDQKIATLFVDDEPALLEVARVFIGSEGNLKVDIAESASAALDVLSVQKYDAVVSDYQMPGMNGIDLLKVLRERGDKTPFILFTGKGREEIVIEALNNGADFYLQKGGDLKSQFAELTNMIRQLVSQRRSEMALRESEERYRTMFESMRTATIMIEDDMTISPANHEFEKLTGYSKEEIESKMKSTDFVSEEYLQKIKDQQSRRTTSGAVPNKYQVQMKNKNGDIKDAVLTIDVIPGTKRSVASVSDITERMRIERALEKKMEEQRMLLDNIDAMVWYTTDPETYGAVNRARAEFLGKGKEDLEGKKIQEVIPIAEESQALIASNREVFEKKKTMNIEEWITAANGERRLISVTKTPMFDENGNVKFVVFTGIDITETRKKEEELKLATSKLNLCGSLLRHDILNQLSVIAGYSKLAMDEVKDPRLAKNVERIVGATRAINKALAFAKNYQDVGTKAPVWKNPNKSLEEALVGLDLRNIAVEADLSEMEIFADPMLDRVFHNLVDNACRHGNGVKTIRIHCERSGDDLRLICEDDGIGVPEDKKERLFSSGHGLQMVRDILEITGMTIAEKGEYGKGASFEIDIPTGKFRFLNQDP
jgi:PAS domain S-box-containing protein